MKIDLPHKGNLSGLRELWREAFDDDDEYLDDFWRTAFSFDRCRCCVINGNVAASLYWFNCLHSGKRIAYLYAIATAKEYRRQGLCHILMEDTHRYLQSLGYEGAILVPGSKKLFDFYRAMGYTTCSCVSELHCCASDESIEIREIDGDEYARLRRQLLPQGGILQENESISFLQTQAVLYAGNDFILAAQVENESLYGMELLGNICVAPAILQALGYAHGTFRIPGNDIPFAMYYPLGDSKLIAPVYFGLAFD